MLPADTFAPSITSHLARLKFQAHTDSTGSQYLPDKTYFGEPEEFAGIWLPSADVSNNADNVAAVTKRDQEYLTLPAGTWGLEVVIAANYSFANAMLGLLKVMDNSDDIILYAPAITQSSTGSSLLTSSDVQYGVITIKEPLVESDGTAQLERS